MDPCGKLRTRSFKVYAGTGASVEECSLDPAIYWIYLSVGISLRFDLPRVKCKSVHSAMADAASVSVVVPPRF